MPKKNNNYALIVLSPSYYCTYRQRITTGVINNKKQAIPAFFVCQLTLSFAKPAAVSHATPSGFLRVRGSTAASYSTAEAGGTLRSTGLRYQGVSIRERVPTLGRTRMATSASLALPYGNHPP